MRRLEGGCSCGSIRYVAEAAPSVVTLCHCDMCRRSAGAQSVTWATVPRASLTMSGAEPGWYDSSPRARRGFCARCGTSLFFVAKASPDEIDVTVGSLDDPNACPATCHIHVPSKLDWVSLEPGLPCHVADSSSPLV